MSIPDAPSVKVYTSEDAARFQDESGKREVDMIRVSRALKNAGIHGRICEEVETELRLRHTTCSARMRDLEKAGIVFKTERKRRTSSGMTARVYNHITFQKRREG